MPLAFSDSGLAYLAIAASRLRSKDRGRWLRKVARQLEGPSRMAVASRQRRERMKNGTRCYHVFLDEVSIEELLIGEGLLPAGKDQYARAEVEAALQSFLAALIAIRGELHSADRA